MRPGRWTALLLGAVGAVLIGVGTLSAQAGPRARSRSSDRPGTTPTRGRRHRRRLSRLSDRRGEDEVPGQPQGSSGVIDPSPVQTDQGRFLLYKTNRAPGTIRLIAMDDAGLHVKGRSRELVRHSDSIENPTIVQRGKQFVLFASANWWDQCRYATVWRRSNDIWSFADKREHVLTEQRKPGSAAPVGRRDARTGRAGPSAAARLGLLGRQRPVQGPRGGHRQEPAPGVVRRPAGVGCGRGDPAAEGLDRTVCCARAEADSQADPAADPAYAEGHRQPEGDREPEGHAWPEGNYRPEADASGHAAADPAALGRSQRARDAPGDAAADLAAQCR
ncbi:hypothetical protein HJ590_12530 [Naumannella sp. ID2617S]|nr:hypothetical protein [Naumannella sp. ID2617S]